MGGLDFYITHVFSKGSPFPIVWSLLQRYFWAKAQRLNTEVFIQILTYR